MVPPWWPSADQPEGPGAEEESIAPVALYCKRSEISGYETGGGAACILICSSPCMRPTEAALAHRPLEPAPGRPHPLEARRLVSAAGDDIAGPAGAGSSGQGDEPGPPVDPRHHCGRAAHGGARHDDHDHRPALGAARSRVLQHGPAVGGHRLHARLRRLPPPGRAHQRHVRAEAHADDRRGRLRPGVGRRRGVADDAHADRRPRAAGTLRRAAGPLGAVDPHLDLLRPA